MLILDVYAARHRTQQGCVTPARHIDRS